MKSIKIQDNSADIVIASVPNGLSINSGVETLGRTYVELENMQTAAEGLLHVSSLLSQIGTDVEELANTLSFSQKLSTTSDLREKLRKDKANIDLLVN